MLRSQRRTHAWIWKVLFVLLPLMPIGGLVLKLTRPPLPAVQQLQQP